MSMINLTIKARLVSTLGLVGLLLIAIGVMGVAGMSRSNESLENMYLGDTAPTAQIAEIQQLLLLNRLAIAVSLVTPTPEEIRKNTAEIEGNIAAITKVWDEYLAGPISEERRRLADKFAEDRKKFVQGGLKPAIEMLHAGKIEQAKKHVVDAIRPLYGPVGEGIAALMKHQVNTAKTRHEESAQTAALLRNVAVAMILFGLAIAGAMGWLLIKAITVPLNAAVAVAGKIAAGDLDNQIEIQRDDEIGKLLMALRGMNEQLARIAGDVRDSADSVGSAAKQISAGNNDLSQRTQEQASALEETASSMEEMTSTTKQNADNARQANQLATGARDQAEKGGEVVTKAVAAMSEINASSRKIADIIGVIDEIAFQTNLLALNAAVEAARAGEQGRGFAVVASEVRNLAQRSAGAAKEIKGLINESVDKVKTGSELVDASGKTLTEIVASVKKVTDIVAEIAAASQEQSAGIEQVNKAVMQMDEVTQQNAALVEEAAAASKSMEEQAEKMVELMGFFKVSGMQAAAPKPKTAPKGNGPAHPQAEHQSPKLHVPHLHHAHAAVKGNGQAAPAAKGQAAKARPAADEHGQWQEF